MSNYYKKNFLKNVLAKVEFANPMLSLKSESITETLDQIRKRFPIAEQTHAFQHKLQITQGTVSNSKLEFPEWRFHGSEREKTFKFNQLFVEVLLKKYVSEESFKEDLVLPISIILKIEPQLLVRKTTVKFVNIFEFFENPKDILNYFSIEISSHIQDITNQSTLIRSFLINEYLFDDIKIRVQSGLFNPDYPAVIKRNHFVLDIQASYELPHTIKDIEGYFGKLHTAVQNYFESLITQKLRDNVLNG